MTWLSIDGGNEAKTGRACYVAEWLAPGGLVLVHQWTIEDVRLRGVVQYEHVVVERHQQDGRIAGGGGRVPPGVVIDLAWNTAAVAYTLARGAAVYEYTPAVWIGGTQKAVLHQRIYAALTPVERAVLGDEKAIRRAITENLRRQVLGKPPLKHRWFNILDAVGVGLFHKGRVGKGAAPVRAAR